MKNFSLKILFRIVTKSSPTLVKIILKLFYLVAHFQDFFHYFVAESKLKPFDGKSDIMAK